MSSPITGLRPWLKQLAGSGRLSVMRPGVPLEFEIAAVGKILDGSQASIFPRAGDTSIPVVTGIVSRRDWMAEILGVAEPGLLNHFQQAADAPLPWRECADGPVQSVVHHNIDLPGMLPAPVHNEHDGGQYISAGLLISRDPDTGIQNVSINRCQLQGGNRIGVLILPRHTWDFHNRAERAGKALEIAIVIGADPISLLTSQAVVPIGHDELEITGALHGSPLDVVKCTTNSVRVPASAEIVLEGRVLADVREDEGPFGEFPQYYGKRARQHVIEIDAVTHRRRPIFHTIVGGGLEHLVLGQIPREATLLAHLRRSFANVLDVHLPKGGVCRYNLVVQINKQREGEARNIILGAFGGHYDIKQVVVVDSDVNIHDPDEVAWAITTRTQADRDYLIIPGALGSRLDPSTDAGISAKLGIDATAPVDAGPLDYTRIRVPGEDTLNPDDYREPNDTSAVLDLLDDTD